jgi:hypothetical protein
VDHQADLASVCSAWLTIRIGQANQHFKCPVNEEGDHHSPVSLYVRDLPIEPHGLIAATELNLRYLVSVTLHVGVWGFVLQFRPLARHFGDDTSVMHNLNFGLTFFRL